MNPIIKTKLSHYLFAMEQELDGVRKNFWITCILDTSCLTVNNPQARDTALCRQGYPNKKSPSFFESFFFKYRSGLNKGVRLGRFFACYIVVQRLAQSFIKCGCLVVAQHFFNACASQCLGVASALFVPCLKRLKVKKV
jgi:hypothetical protein